MQAGGDVTVIRADGSDVVLSSFWEDADCLLLFLRHFACPSCSVRLSKLLPRLHQLRALGVRVVIVGLGSTRALRTFARRMKLDGGGIDLVVSPNLEAHRWAGLSRSKWATYGPRSVAASIALYVLGHGATRHEDDGDVLQQGGVLFVRTGGEIAFRHADRDLADGPELSEAVQAALASAAERSDAPV
jgi:peroxiredoxin